MTSAGRGSVDARLTGLRVLVVEDSFLIAARLSDMLEELGCQVVGPAPGVAEAFALIDAGGCDAAILDINLGTETAEPLAARLETERIPFFFVTGYASPARMSPRYAGARQLKKPLDPGALRQTMIHEFAGGGGPAST